MSFIHPSAYLSGGSPASTPLVQLWEWKTPQSHDYHAAIPLNLSTLSYYVYKAFPLNDRMGNEQYAFVAHEELPVPAVQEPMIVASVLDYWTVRDYLV